MSRSLCLLLVIIGCSNFDFGTKAYALQRSFTDVTGQYNIVAEFVELRNGIVVLYATDGNQIKLPLDKLSDKDRAYVVDVVSADGDNADDEQTLTPEQKELATAAKIILQDTCYSCHGADGSNEGGFNFVLRRDSLTDGGQYIEPGNPDGSYLLERVESGEMPEPGHEPRPSDADIATLRKWIEMGAPDFDKRERRTPITTTELESAIKLDLKNFTDRDRRFKRYFSLTHLYNANVSQDELETYRLALTKLLNSVSWNREIVIPSPINATQTILRIDMREVNWSNEIWAEVLRRYPYGFLQNEQDLQFFTDSTMTKLPFVRADWFVSVASRPPLYHQILQIPETDRELETLLRVDVANNIEQDNVIRAAFNRSGVSQHNRMIERHKTPYGSYWKSYDFAGSADRRNVFQYPMGPSDDDTSFLHDGGEMIFTLPNGLQGYMLTDNHGNRLDVGPTQIVSDPSRPDRTVVNGTSCMSCHYAGMIKKNDEVRAHVESNRKSFSEADDILAIYVDNRTFDRQLEEDASRFQRAMYQIGIDRLTKSGEPVSNMSRRFEKELDLTHAAAEFGLSRGQFQRWLKTSPKLSRSLGQLTVPGGTMKRDAFVQVFIEAVGVFQLGITISTTESLGDGLDIAGGAGPSIAPSDLTPTIAKIMSGNHFATIEGLKELRANPPRRPSKSTIKAVTNVIDGNEYFARREAFETLAVIDPKGSLNVIIKGLTDQRMRSICFDILARLKDPNSIDAIAGMLVSDTRGALKVLEAIGPSSEKHLQEYLKATSGSWIKQKPVVEALGRIGTSDSIRALQKLTRSRQAFIPDLAKQAIRDIKFREKLNE